jgi:hypothetical protein
MKYPEKGTVEDRYRKRAGQSWNPGFIMRFRSRAFIIKKEAESINIL